MKKINWTIKLSVLSSLVLPTFFISCSNNQYVNVLTEEQINKEYDKFSNALVKENIKSNLYFENFIFDANNQAILSLEEINNLLSFENLSNAYEYQFILNKDLANNSIKIKMQLKIKNSNSNFVEYQNKELIINSVKSLTADEKLALNNIYNNWNQNSSKVTIKNTKTNQVLDPAKYSTILPSYLQINDINFDYSTVGINQTIPNSNIKTVMTFNDYLGQIEWDLSIINSKTNLIFYPDNVLNKQMIISGFTRLNDRNLEIIDIFDKLSRTFSIVTLIGPDKKIPYLSSGVTTVEQFKTMFEIIKNNLKEANNQYVDNILQILNDAINNTKWFNLEMSSTANDITGNLVVTWKLIDRFTSYEIFPSNINKITTINNMLTLSKKVVVNNEEIEDLSAIDNGYKAYQSLTSLEINSKYKELPSNNIISSINIDWLLTNTNIKTLFPNIVKSQDNKYLEFNLTTNGKTNNFRFALDLTKVTDIKPNLIMGTIQLPFIMQIQLDEQFVSITPNANNPVVKSTQYIDFLPPSGKSDSSNNSSYNSAQRSAFISIGGYLTKDLEIAAIIYDYFATNKEITININNENYFNEILNKCLDDESQIATVLESEIKETILKSILANQAQTNNSADIKKFLEKYKLEFALVKNKLSSYDDTNKIITSSEIEIKIIPNNESNSKVYMEYYKNGVSTTLPKVKFVIKYIPS